MANLKGDHLIEAATGEVFTDLLEWGDPITGSARNIDDIARVRAMLRANVGGAVLLTLDSDAADGTVTITPDASTVALLFDLTGVEEGYYTYDVEVTYQDGGRDVLPRTTIHAIQPYTRS